MIETKINFVQTTEIIIIKYLNMTIRIIIKVVETTIIKTIVEEINIRKKDIITIDKRGITKTDIITEFIYFNKITINYF